MFRRFGTLYSIFVGDEGGGVLTPRMNAEQTWCFETSSHRTQSPGNYPKERIEQCKLRCMDLRNKYFFLNVM